MDLKKLMALDVKGHDLMTLAVVIDTMRGFDGIKAKGEFLIDMFRAYPYLVSYFQATYDMRFDYRITIDDAMAAKGTPISTADEDIAGRSCLGVLKALHEGRAENPARVWAEYMRGLDKELRLAASSMLARNIGGLPLKAVNKAIREAGFREIGDPQRGRP